MHIEETLQEDIKQLNHNLTDVLVTLKDHGTTLEFIKQQTTLTNGRVSKLETDMQAVTPAVKALELDKAEREGVAKERRRFLTGLATPIIIAALIGILKMAGVLDINFVI